jgi:hypothetical protein
VSHIYEPYGWKSICGPGSARIVLAFTASPQVISKNWGTIASYGYMVKPKAEKVKGKTVYEKTTWTPSTSSSKYQDGYGTALMMHIASIVTSFNSATGNYSNSYQDIAHQLNALSGDNLSKPSRDRTDWFSFVSTAGMAASSNAKSKFQTGSPWESWRLPELESGGVRLF